MSAPANILINDTSTGIPSDSGYERMSTNTPTTSETSMSNYYSCHNNMRSKQTNTPIKLTRNEQNICTESLTEHRAAVCIQKIWRGYRTRNLDPKVLKIYQMMYCNRTNQNINKLLSDMELARGTLTRVSSLQEMQMSIIRKMWSKLISIDKSQNELPDEDKKTQLYKQMDELHGSLNAVLEWMRSCKANEGPRMAGIQSEMGIQTTRLTDLALPEQLESSSTHVEMSTSTETPSNVSMDSEPSEPTPTEIVTGILDTIIDNAVGLD